MLVLMRWSCWQSDGTLTEQRWWNLYPQVLQTKPWKSNFRQLSQKAREKNVLLMKLCDMEVVIGNFSFSSTIISSPSNRAMSWSQERRVLGWALYTEQTSGESLRRLRALDNTYRRVRPGWTWKNSYRFLWKLPLNRENMNEYLRE